MGIRNFHSEDIQDQGPLSLEETSENDGNFRAFLHYPINGGDESLKAHVTSCSLSGLYLSFKIQNAIIETCGELNQSQFVHQINEAECLVFSPIKHVAFLE